MFRFILTLVLFNTYYLTFGLPVPEKVSYLPLGNKLQALAQNCENAVISNLIKSQVEYCNTSSPLDKHLEPKCLMFFDINKQLCETFDKSKYDIQSDYTSKMKETQDVQSLCQKAGSWKPKYAQEYPVLDLEKVFKNEVLCVLMCANEEHMSVDVNFFCKYYKWGSEAIKNATAPLPQMSNEIDSGSKTVQPSVKQNNEGTVDIVATLNKIDSSTPSRNETVPKQLEEKPTKIESTKPNTINADATTVINHSSTNAGQKTEIESPVKTEQSAAPILPTAVKIEIEKPIVASEDKDNKKSNDLKDKDSVIDNPKDDGIIEDDQEDDEEDDHQYDQDGSILKPMSKPDMDTKNEGNNNELPIFGQNNDNKPPEPETGNDEKRKKSRIEIENDTTFKIYSGPQIVAEIFPNSMQDSLNDDDDHFFPLFLTAVVIVIILYIVYHNKNKFSKVILGLIVEGRQPGKRRNSRGHAYRRLDTLEQAMSTNTAAPPSKIIY